VQVLDSYDLDLLDACQHPAAQASSTWAHIEGVMASNRPQLTQQQYSPATQQQPQGPTLGQGSHQQCLLQLPAAGLSAVVKLLVACLTDSSGLGAGLTRSEAMSNAAYSTRPDSTRRADSSVAESFGTLVDIVLYCSSSGLQVLQQLLGVWQQMLPADAAQRTPGLQAATPMEAEGADPVAGTVTLSAADISAITEAIRAHPLQAADFLSRLMACVFNSLDEAGGAAAGLPKLQYLLVKSQQPQSPAAWLNRSSAVQLRARQLKLPVLEALAGLLPGLQQLLCSADAAAAIQWHLAHRWRHLELLGWTYGRHKSGATKSEDIHVTLKQWMQWLGEVQLQQQQGPGGQLCEQAVQQLLLLTQSGAAAAAAAGVAAAADPAHLARALMPAVEWWGCVRNKAPKQKKSLQAGIQVCTGRWSGFICTGRAASVCSMPCELPDPARAPVDKLCTSCWHREHMRTNTVLLDRQATMT
jgi:hypothetical protein